MASDPEQKREAGRKGGQASRSHGIYAIANRGQAALREECGLHGTDRTYFNGFICWPVASAKQQTVCSFLVGSSQGSPRRLSARAFSF